MDFTSDYALSRLHEYAQLLIEKNKQKLGVFDVPPHKRKYVLYARKSTKDSKKQEKSIDDQVKECQSYAKTLGLRVVEVIREEESAKKSEQRDKFSEMLKNLTFGVYNAILCWHPDRLARNMKDAGQIIR